MFPPVQIWQNPPRERIGHSVKEFLCNLGGPAWIDITGQDSSRTRVLTTLLHGNEPSGTKALFNWLSDPDRTRPMTNLSILICSVEAALAEPEFSHRYMPGAPDMNRCFRPPFDSDNGRLAEAILKRIQTLKPETVIDIHNTSGSGPDFVVTTKLDPHHVNLAKKISRRMILTRLKLGALMEAEMDCPVITLECGGSIDFDADQTALNALKLIATKNDLFQDDEMPEPDIFRHPLRLELKDGVTITYAEFASSECDITLTADIEKHNFGITEKNDFLGWVGARGLDYFTAFDDKGCDIKHDLFTVREDKLFTKRSLRLFMVTPRPEIARRDCLFYLVRA